MNGLRLYGRYVGTSIRAQAQYPAVTLMLTAGHLAATAIEILGVYALFHRFGQVQGWSFRPVFVLIDDVVVHKVSNGEPNIRRVEDKKNPLGPLQGAGEYFSDKLK